MRVVSVPLILRVTILIFLLLAIPPAALTLLFLMTNDSPGFKLRMAWVSSEALPMEYLGGIGIPVSILISVSRVVFMVFGLVGYGFVVKRFFVVRLWWLVFGWWW